MFMWFVSENNSELFAQGSTSSFHWLDQQCCKCSSLPHSWSQAERGAVTFFKTDWSTDSTQLRNYFATEGRADSYLYNVHNRLVAKKRPQSCSSLLCLPSLNALIDNIFND